MLDGCCIIVCFICSFVTADYSHLCLLCFFIVYKIFAKKSLENAEMVERDEELDILEGRGREIQEEKKERKASKIEKSDKYDEGERKKRGGGAKNRRAR